MEWTLTTSIQAGETPSCGHNGEIIQGTVLEQVSRAFHHTYRKCYKHPR